MRRLGLTLLFPMVVLVAQAAKAQPDPGQPPSAPSGQTPPADSSQPAGQPSGSSSAAPPPSLPPSPPKLPESAAARPPAPPPISPPQPIASPRIAVKPVQPAAPPAPRRLAPTFPEDRYPGDDPASSTEVDLPRPGTMAPLKFAMHGYFRAPLRFSRVRRETGSTTPEEGNYNYRTPLLADDDYYLSGFSYLPINQKPWNETYLSVGNERMTATVGLMNSQFADNEDYNTASQFGVAQAWLTYRYKPVEGLSIRVKGGAFWDRFGYLPKYDTYIFGRTHQMGGQARAEYETGPFTFWLLGGMGAHSELIKSKQGFTMVNYAHAGISYDRLAEVGVYYLSTSANDKRKLQELTDASMDVLGIDGRLHTPAGKLYVAYSAVSADKVLFLSPALELMHSYGRAVMDNYLGSEKSNSGTGGLKNLAFQYDVSLVDLVRGMTGSQESPLPWGGDFTASVFGMLTKVRSDQTSEDPRANRDGITKWKWGTEGGWRATEWAGMFVRYDRVVLDTQDSANSFRVISPRIVLFTHFLSQEQIYFQFSRYWYNELVKPRGDVAMEPSLDEKVFKIQAQIAY